MNEAKVVKALEQSAYTIIEIAFDLLKLFRFHLHVNELKYVDTYIS